ncbi:hypothetical protein KQI74_03640 [Paenibacillus barcinonensis]|nr:MULTISPECIES: hypothetical protein [Paenibacillus]MBU5351359.1 hypothetical protein [Paenibacillus barcinonensis]MDM5278013.1 hypothetical protein [Paenibacillus silvae]
MDTLGPVSDSSVGVVDVVIITGAGTITVTMTDTDVEVDTDIGTDIAEI